MVLCGGLGTRLGSLTADMPKPLLSVAGRPFLDVLLFELGRHGIDDVILLASFRSDKIEAYASDNAIARRFGMKIRTVVEPTQAGTGGALSHAASVADEHFLLLNGDSWFDFNLLSLCDLVSREPEADFALSLREVPDANRFGVVLISGDRVTDFLERPPSPGRGW